MRIETEKTLRGVKEDINYCRYYSDQKRIEIQSKKQLYNTELDTCIDSVR